MQTHFESQIIPKDDATKASMLLRIAQGYLNARVDEHEQIFIIQADYQGTRSQAEKLMHERLHNYGWTNYTLN